jgi:hypothetical protein
MSTTTEQQSGTTRIRLVAQGGRLRPAPAPVERPTIRGRDVTLLAPVPGDYPALYNEEVFGPHAKKLRFPGGISFEGWRNTVDAATDAHYLVVRRGVREAPVGYIWAYGREPRAGHIWLGAMRFAEDREGLSTAMMSGWALFVQSLFTKDAAIRKFYMEVAEFNFHQFSSGMLRTERGRERGYYVQEGFMPDHAELDGRLYPMRTLAVYRETWFEERIQRLVRRQLDG